MAKKKAVEEQNKQAVVLPDGEKMVERFAKWYRAKWMHGPDEKDLLLYHEFMQERINEGSV